MYRRKDPFGSSLLSFGPGLRRANVGQVKENHARTTVILGLRVTILIRRVFDVERPAVEELANPDPTDSERAKHLRACLHAVDASVISDVHRFELSNVANLGTDFATVSRVELREVDGRNGSTTDDSLEREEDIRAGVHEEASVLFGPFRFVVHEETAVVEPREIENLAEPFGGRGDERVP